MNSLAGQSLGRLRHSWTSYRLRWKRRELLWRAIRARRKLTPLADLTNLIRDSDILVFATVRNEASRLPEFLAHYRKLGVGHFLIVDNNSNDGTIPYLLKQPDVSLWRCRESYRDARFGMDWIGALLMRHGHGHWCVTVDADELLIYPDWERQDLGELTTFLDDQGIEGMGALMLDLYPQLPLGQTEAPSHAPLTKRLPWFDSGPYRCEITMPKRNRVVRGGVRERMFFAGRTGLSPTLNKLPLVRWHWRYTYVNSTHSLLPAHLNELYDGPGDLRPCGILLHGKFLPVIIGKSAEELKRRQHFAKPENFVDYHKSLTAAPTLWNDESRRYTGWEQLVELGLMGSGVTHDVVLDKERVLVKLAEFKRHGR